MIDMTDDAAKGKGRTRMKIGEVADAAGVNVQTVRYYERRGLLKEPPRTASGYREFEPRVVRRIRFIRQAQDLGFTLSEIDELLELRVDKPERCEQVEARARAKRDEVRRKLAELRRMDEVLSDLVSSCMDRAPTDECPILAALEEGGTS